MSRTKALGATIAALALIAIFISLGFWQLDRARQLQALQQPYQDLPSISLSEVAEPSENLTDSAINRIVTFSGSYVMQFTAPNQIDRNKNKADWLVGLLEVDGGGAILVVRSTRNGEMPRGDLQITGRLFPRQFEDRSEKVEGELSRLDPSLVSSLYSDALYDGYVVATIEVDSGLPIQLPRVDLVPARPTVPGYYWQHIAYVAIWWLMALVVVFLPFYNRWRKRP
jgi:hypothetical protein